MLKGCVNNTVFFLELGISNAKAIGCKFQERVLLGTIFRKQGGGTLTFAEPVFVLFQSPQSIQREVEDSGKLLLQLFRKVDISLLLAEMLREMEKAEPPVKPLAAVSCVRQIVCRHHDLASREKLKGLFVLVGSGNARDRKSTRLNSSHTDSSRMPSSA